MTKADQKQLAALELRLLDMAQGVMGHCDFDSTGEDGGLAFTMGTEEWLTWIRAVKKTFMESGWNSSAAESVAFELWNLHHFSITIEASAEHLFNFGARP